VLWERFGSDLPQLLRETAWGERLLNLGFGPDLDLCAQVDVTHVVPQMEGGRITLGEPRAESLERRAESRESSAVSRDRRIGRRLVGVRAERIDKGIMAVDGELHADFAHPMGAYGSNVPVDTGGTQQWQMI
jgi:hypothetical protein